MRISDWSSDVCSSDLAEEGAEPLQRRAGTEDEVLEAHGHVARSAKDPPHLGVGGRAVEPGAGAFRDVPRAVGHGLLRQRHIAAVANDVGAEVLRDTAIHYGQAWQSVLSA